MSILIMMYPLGMLFLPISSYFAQTTSAMAVPSLARMFRFSALVFRGASSPNSCKKNRRVLPVSAHKLGSSLGDGLSSILSNRPTL